MTTNGITMEELRTLEAIQHMARNQLEIRDIIASQVLQSQFKTVAFSCTYDAENSNELEEARKICIAKQCYDWADAMLKAR